MGQSIVYPTRNRKMEALVASQASIDDAMANASLKSDGWVWAGLDGFSLLSTSASAVLTRNADGDFCRSRTAGGAETWYAVCYANPPTRLTAGKGFKVTDFVVSYTLGVADATTVDFLSFVTTYANAVAIAPVAYGAGFAYDANHLTNAARIASAGGSNPHLMTCAFTTPAVHSADSATLVAQVAFVLANTGTLKVNGFGYHVTFPEA